MENWISLRGERLQESINKKYAGVGFIKGESIGLNTGLSPFVKERLAIISEYIVNTCILFKEKPVFYRLNCHSSRTMNSLIGNTKYLNETSPFLGLIGIRRYLEYLDESEYELEVLSNLSLKHKNLGIVLPFINNSTQYKLMKNRLIEYGFSGQVGVMLEIPSALFSIEDFISEGCKYFLIGTNDLTSLMLGVARYEPSVLKYFNRADKTVVELIKNTLKKVQNYHVKIGITGYLSENDLEVYKNLGLNFVSHYLG